MRTGNTKPVHIDVTVELELFGKLRSKDFVSFRREVAESIGDGKLMNISFKLKTRQYKQQNTQRERIWNRTDLC